MTCFKIKHLIPASKSFLFIQDSMQKKNSEDPPDPRYINHV